MGGRRGTTRNVCPALDSVGYRPPQVREQTAGQVRPGTDYCPPVGSVAGASFAAMPVLTGLTAADAQRWLRGLRLFHVERLALVAVIVAEIVVGVVSSNPACTPSDPSLCGPSVGATWALALMFATPALLLAAPTLGCLSGIALGIVGFRYDDVQADRKWWAVSAVLCALVFVHVMLIRVRQRRLMVARQQALPVFARVGSPGRSMSVRAWFISVALVAGVVLALIYEHQASAKQRHETHASQLVATVLSTHDGDNPTVDLIVPGLDQPVTVGVYSADNYRLNQDVPVVADQSGAEPWVRLVAEPEDPTSWLSFAMLALLLAAVAALRPAQAWWRRRRGGHGYDRAVFVSLYEDVILPVDASGPPIATARTPSVPVISVGDGDPPVDGTDEPAERAPFWLAGQLWYGGLVGLISVDGAQTQAVLGLPQWGFTRSWLSESIAPVLDRPLSADSGASAVTFAEQTLNPASTASARNPTQTVKVSRHGLVDGQTDLLPVRASDVLAAIVFGLCGALLGAAVVVGVESATGEAGGLLSSVLGLCVAYGVYVGAPMLSPRVRRLTAVLVTGAGIVLWEYVSMRQFLGITHTPLLLSTEAVTSGLRADLGHNLWAFLFWALALVIAGSVAAHLGGARDGVDDSRPGRSRGRKLVDWAIGPGRGWTAILAATAGLASLIVLARVQLISGAVDPSRSLVTGDCYNLSNTSLTRLPCAQEHDDEVFYRLTLPAGPYRGDYRTTDAANKACDGHLADYVGPSGGASAYFSYSLPPDRVEWATGDRLVVCALARIDEQKITGTARATK
jgi:hypothetical protein